MSKWYSMPFSRATTTPLSPTRRRTRLRRIICSPSSHSSISFSRATRDAPSAEAAAAHTSEGLSWPFRESRRAKDAVAAVVVVVVVVVVEVVSKGFFVSSPAVPCWQSSLPRSQRETAAEMDIEADSPAAATLFSPRDAPPAPPIEPEGTQGTSPTHSHRQGRQSRISLSDSDSDSDAAPEPPRRRRRSEDTAAATLCCGACGAGRLKLAAPPLPDGAEESSDSSAAAGFFFFFSEG